MYTQYGEAATRCDLDAAERLLPELSPQIKKVLRETQSYVRSGVSGEFSRTPEIATKTAEVNRKTSRRARLLDTERSAQLRAEWEPRRHNTTPLHYRWKVVRTMLADLSDGP